MIELPPNCKAYSQDSTGLVTGVLLGITPIATGNYELYSVALRAEGSPGAADRVARCQVLDKNLVRTQLNVRMAWPGKQPPFQGSGLPGNAENTHVIVNGYNPPNTGPLCLFVGEQDSPDSDILWGLGLPYNHHVSFDIVFAQKGAGTGTTPDPRIARFETWALAVSAKYPGGPQYVRLSS